MSVQENLDRAVLMAFHDLYATVRPVAEHCGGIGPAHGIKVGLASRNQAAIGRNFLHDLTRRGWGAPKPRAIIGIKGNLNAHRLRICQQGMQIPPTGFANHRLSNAGKKDQV